MKIALVSLNQAWEDKEANLHVCEEYIKKASDKEVDLIIFPEMTLTGFSNNTSLTAEDYEHSQTIDKFSNLAKKLSINTIFGVVVKDNDKALNSALFIDKNGQILGRYTKIHPFSFAAEDRFFNAGSTLSTVEADSMKIGLSICYDLRFPELYSAMAKECDMVINIANWPAKRVEHWNALLRARAIENQIFIAGINRTGRDGNGLEYVESSNIFNANGEMLEFAELGDMKIYEISKNWTKEFKNKFNTTNDRKIEFYKEIL